jgi:hypothetical protein
MKALARLLAGLRRPTVDELLGWLVLGATAALAFHRLRFGVTFADEPFYAVVTQRYALGDRPYIDEVNLRQTASLLTVPLYWLHLKVAGTSGIVYFLRLVYFAVQCLVAAAAFRLVRARLGLSYALVAAAAPLAFVPFAIPAGSYNSWGALLFALGMCLALRGVLAPGPRRPLVLAGVAHGLACVAYPPLAAPVLVIGAVTPFVLPVEPGRRRWRAALPYAAGVAGVGAVFLAFLAPSIARGFAKAMQYEGMLTRPRTGEKLQQIVEACVRLAPGSPTTPVSLAVAWLLARRFPAVRRTLVALLVFPIAWWFAEARPAHELPAHVLSLHVALYVGLLGGFFLLLPRTRAPVRPLLLVAWLPAVLAGLAMAMSSDNVGCMNAGLGLFAGAVVFPLMAVPGCEPDAASTPLGRLPVLAGLALVPLSMLHVSYGGTYWDGPVSAQTTRVRIGPFRGLHTLPGKAAQAEELTREIRAHAKPGQRMLVFYETPAAYLVVPARPALPTSWTDRRARLSAYLPYYHAHRTGEGLVVRIMNSHGVSPELEALVEVPGRLLKDAGWFRLYREPPP